MLQPDFRGFFILLTFMAIQMRLLLALAIFGIMFPISAMSVPVEDMFDRNQAGNRTQGRGQNRTEKWTRASLGRVIVIKICAIGST